jgi:segregation and condensation protein A
MAELPADFKATLESYQGPLDLLLYLIKKEEVDIFDIPIGRITEQYFQYLSILQAVDPNSCGEFLVMASNLMEIKSRSLLPTEPALEGEAGEDPRIELVRQLLEYKKYKERALLLARRIDEFGRRFNRPPIRLPDQPPEEMEDPLVLGSVSVWDLLSAFHRVQLSLGERVPHRVVFEERPIDEYIAAIQEKGAGRDRGRILFDDLFGDCRDVYDALGYFLAMLEMAKRRLVRFHQEVLFGPIEIEVLPEPPTDATFVPADVTAEGGPAGVGTVFSPLGPPEGTSVPPPLGPPDPPEPTGSARYPTSGAAPGPAEGLPENDPGTEGG